MSWLNPGYPGREAAPPASRLPPSASFGAETSPAGSPLVFFGILAVGALAAGYYVKGERDERALAKAEAERAILARMKYEKELRDEAFSKAAYHATMMKNLDLRGEQKARLARWKADRP